MLGQRQLHEDADLLVAHPIRPGGFDAGPGPAAAAIDLATLEREIDVIAARIAGDDFHLGAEHAVDDARELVGIGRRASAADAQLLREEVIELGSLATAVPDDADAHLVVGAADPVE